MYTRQEASLVRKKFWTSLGQYMRPVAGAQGDAINWLNYKTGIRHIYFRMDANKEGAAISIEIKHSDPEEQLRFFNQFLQLKAILEQATGETWDWQSLLQDEDGNTIGRIGKTLTGKSIFNEGDWPAIISFLKPRIIALDDFWETVKDGFAA